MRNLLSAIEPLARACTGFEALSAIYALKDIEPDASFVCVAVPERRQRGLWSKKRLWLGRTEATPA